MRRKDKEITDEEFIYSLLKRAKVLRLGLSDNNMPYIVPLNFGIKENHLYFHSVKKGKKIDILKKNRNVCFEIDLDSKFKEAEKPCEHGTDYYSVIGFGVVVFIEDLKEKKEALNVIIEHYTGKLDNELIDSMIKRVSVFKVVISEISGKKSGY